MVLRLGVQVKSRAWGQLFLAAALPLLMQRWMLQPPVLHHLGLACE